MCLESATNTCCDSPLARIHRSQNQMLEKGVAHLTITLNGLLVKYLLFNLETMGSIGLNLNSQRRNASTMGYDNDSIKTEAEIVTWLFLASLCQETKNKESYSVPGQLVLIIKGKLVIRKSMSRMQDIPQGTN